MEITRWGAGDCDQISNIPNVLSVILFLLARKLRLRATLAALSVGCLT